MKYLGKRSLSSFLKGFANVTWYALLILFSGICLALLLQVSNETHRTYKWPVTLSQTPVQSINDTDKEGFAGAGIIIKSGELTFRGENNWKNVGITLAGLIFPFGTILLIIFQLRKILASFVSDHPFVESNIPRIRFIGLVLIVAPILKFLFGIPYTNYLSDTFKDYGFENRLDADSILSGLLIIVIAEIFRIGVALRQEQDLTV